jgi:DNA polymerase
LPFLKKQIELVNPKIIFILGRSAANALLDNAESISSLRGRFIDYTSPNGTVFPTLSSFHPAYLLRTCSQKGKSWADLLRLKRKLAEM